jgi:hypothetical protein
MPPDLIFCSQALDLPDPDVRGVSAGKLDISTTLSDSQQLAESGMLRQPNAGVEKRAFRLAGRDPRWVPTPARQSCCRRVLLARVTPAHGWLRIPLSACGPAESDKVVLVVSRYFRRSALVRLNAPHARSCQASAVRGRVSDRPE